MLPEVLHTYQHHHLDSLRWQHFTPRPDDIIISTSYKSGTTWTQEIVRQLVFCGQDPMALQKISLGKMSPWLDSRVRPIGEVIGELKEQTHRRFIKTHLALDGLPFYPMLKYIVVGRDPRDVFMSLWNHYSNYTPAAYDRWNNAPNRVGAPLDQCPDDLHALWQNWITRGWFEWESEGYPFWGNMHHIQSWWNFRHLGNILFVHYNDLLTNLPDEIRRIAHFLQIEISDADIIRIVPALTLDAMRRASQLTDSHSMLWRDGTQTFFYRGSNRRWRGVLSSEELALYDETASRVLTPECRRWLERGREYTLDG